MWKKHGKGWIYEDKKVIFEGEYKDGDIWKGKYYQYKENESIVEHDFSYGEKSGKVIGYYKGGKIQFKAEYLNGKLWQGKEYDINGELIKEVKDGKEIYSKKWFWRRIIWLNNYQN